MTTTTTIITFTFILGCYRGIRGGGGGGGGGMFLIFIGIGIGIGIINIGMIGSRHGNGSRIDI